MMRAFNKPLLPGTRNLCKRGRISRWLRCFLILIPVVLLLVFAAACTQSAEQPVVVDSVTEVLPTPNLVIVVAPTATVTIAPQAEEPKPPEATTTPDPGMNDMPEYYGGLVITLDDVGQTLTMGPKSGFLLRLGSDFDWSVSMTPADVVTENRKVRLEEGEQGVFIARKRGIVTLGAVGSPKCLRSDPPCGRPDVLFKMFIVVE